MDIILIPGLWLDADSWNDVTADLTRAGHTVHALTMPGVGASAAESADIGIADWVAAGVSAVDAVGGPVAVVGHSGGGNVAWGVADARPEAVSRVVFVDTVPPAPGFGISEFEVVDGVIPFPGWETFDADDVADLDDEMRARAAALTQSVPAKVPTDEVALDGGRHRVPVTLLMGGLDDEALRAQLDQWGPYADEFRAIHDAEIVRIGSGHWPQFSVPARLAELIDAAVARRS